MRKIIFILISIGFYLLCWQQIGLCSSKKELVFIGLTLGSAGQMFMTKAGEIINKHVPEVSVTVITGSSMENPIYVQNKRGVVGFTQAHFLKMARSGEKNYKDKPCIDLRFFFYNVSNLDSFLVRADSNIKKVEDLKDKKIIVGPKGYALTEVALAALEAHGLSPQIIRENGGNVIFAADKDASNMIQDKIVDAFFAHSSKTAIITYNLSAETSVGLRPLPYDRDKAEKIIKILGIGRIDEIGGGVYKAQPNPTLSVAYDAVYCIHKDVPNDLVYKMTKAIFEHSQEIVDAAGPFWKAFKIENALLGSEGIPVHPGALKYYNEVGITK